MLSPLIVQVATSLLPPHDQDRFASEWQAELGHVRATVGERSAVRFGLGLLLAAPRMTMTIRATSNTGYVELSVASLALLFPAAAMGTLAAAMQLWIMVAIQVLMAIGSLLTATGLWRDSGRLFDSLRSQAGLLLIVGSAAGGMAFIRLTEFGPRAEEQINAAIPNLAVLVGLVLLASANYVGNFKRRVQLAALSVMAPGAGFSVVVAAINSFAQTGRWRLAVTIYALPAPVLLWACLSVARRPQVFEEVT